MSILYNDTDTTSEGSENFFDVREESLNDDSHLSTSEEQSGDFRGFSQPFLMTCSTTHDKTIEKHSKEVHQEDDVRSSLCLTKYDNSCYSGSSVPEAIENRILKKNTMPTKILIDSALNTHCEVLHKSFGMLNNTPYLSNAGPLVKNPLFHGSSSWSKGSNNISMHRNSNCVSELHHRSVQVEEPSSGLGININKSLDSKGSLNSKNILEQENNCQAHHQPENHTMENITLASEVTMDMGSISEEEGISVEDTGSGVTSMVPIRNLDTGLVRFIDTSGARNAVQEFLNLYSLSNVDITRLRETFTKEGVEESLNEPREDSQSERDIDFNSTPYRSETLITDSGLGLKLEKLKATWRSFTLRTERKSINLGHDTTSDKPVQYNDSERLTKISRFKSFMTRTAENLSHSRSFLSDPSIRTKDVSPTYQATLREVPIFTTLSRKTAKCKESPCLIPVRKPLGKDYHTLSNLWLIQELRIPEPIPIWSFSISHDGRWMAAGTQNGTLYLWKLEASFENDDFESVSSQLSYVENNLDDKTFNSSNFNFSVPLEQEDTAAQLFTSTPTVTLLGHNATIVSCVWDFSSLSNNANRLASASLDRTVRIWTISEDQRGQLKYSVLLNCGDWATCASFHPISRDFIYTGALDGVVQVWRTPLDVKQKADIMFHHPCSSLSATKVNMLESLRMPDLITSMCVSPNGLFLCVGLRLGRVCIYEAQNLRFYTEIECRNRRGIHSTGRKVTGITWKSDSSAFFVSTSDSRIRLINATDFSVCQKFKGHKANQIMLNAHLTTAEQYIVSGSENGFVYIWETSPQVLPDGLVGSRVSFHRYKRSTIIFYERFKAFDELLTCCAVGNSIFSKTILCSLRRLVKKNVMFPAWRSLSTPLHSASCRKLDSSKDAPEPVIATASYAGCIRIFLHLRLGA